MSSERGCRERQHASDAEEEWEEKRKTGCQNEDGEGVERIRRVAPAAVQSRSRNPSKERQQMATAEETGVKRSSGASIWSPHLFHRHQHNKNPQPQPQQPSLNPLQYLNNDYQRQGSMASQRQQLKITTTKSRSPARASSPTTRSSSKASSPISEAPTSSHLYNPPHLHFTHQQPVKETHLLDIDFDPVSGRKSINRYEIIDEIGRGTHGKVKLGRDMVTSEHVAIKIVERNTRPRLGKMVKQEDEKVRREIAILKKCRHNNVVRLIEVIDDPASKKVYLVLEYVELGEIVWRKLGHRDVLRRERLRLKQELMGEGASESDFKDEDEAHLRRWKKRRRKQLKIQHHQSYPMSKSASKLANDENPNCWSLELGGLTEEDDGEISDDYPSVDEDDDQVSRSLSQDHRPQVDAPHIPPLDSDSEEPAMFMRSLSMMAMAGNPDAPPYSFSHEDLQYVPALTFDQARTTFRDTVLGLEYLHYNGIIHRDIKPANLLWTKEYRVKISDFGVSYLGRGAGEFEEDEFGEKKRRKDQVSGRDEEIELAKTVGTPAFFAPELCFFDTSKTRPQITSAIDVWALGVTLYCLIFARCPFLADGEFELFNVIAKQELYIPKRRLRPAQGYIAASSLTRPSSSSRPRSLHQRSQSSASSKSAPPYGRPASGARGKSYSEDNETELIPDDLRDLLKKLLTKDPAKRISIKEVKRHPWVLEGLEDPVEWVEQTDPERVSGGGRIEVNQEEMEKAVVPASWGTTVIGRMKSGINRLRQKMGMGGGGSSDGGGSGKKEKVGLHPLAQRGSNISISREGLYPYPSVQRPGSSSSVSTLQEQIGAMNKFSLSNQPTAPYNSSNLAVPPTSASSLTRLLNGSSPGRPTSNTTVATPSKDKRRLSPSPQRSAVSPNSIKKFFNPSQTSLSTSLSRSISRSSHNSGFSGPESTSPTRTATDTEGTTKKSRSLSLLRRTRSTLSGGERASSRDSSRMASTRTVRRTTSSVLGQELNSSPATSSHSTATVRRCASPHQTPPKKPLASVPAASEPPPQIQFSLQPHRISSTPGMPATTASSRSRRSSASSNSNSINHARETVTGAIGGLFGKGKRLVRSFSRSRDTLASESEAVASGSGGSGDEEREKEKGLRISMLRKKRSHGVEAGPILSRVYARGNVTSPMGESIVEGKNSGEGYFDVPKGRFDGPEDTPGSNDTIMPLSTGLSSTTNTTNTTTTANSSTSASSNALMDQNFPDEALLFKGHQSTSKSGGSDRSCPPSPSDFYERERQNRIREQRRCETDREEADKMARYLTASLNREVNKGSGRSDSAVFPHVPISSTQSQLSGRYIHGTDESANLASSSSEEKMYDHRHHTGTGTSTSLTESTSFPSIESMLDSSAASSVSADGGWGISTLKSPGRAIALNSSVPTSAANPAVSEFGAEIAPPTIPTGPLSKEARDSGFYVNDSQSVYSSQHKHHLSTGSAQIPAVIESPPVPAPLASAYQGYIHSKSDEEDDGDDEGLYMGLGMATRRKSAQLGASGKDATEQQPPVVKSNKALPLHHHHHKRAVSSTSQRSNRADEKGPSSSVNNSPAKDGKERVRRRRSSKGAVSAGSGSGVGGRGRSRSNTASSLAPPPPSPHALTMGASIAGVAESHVGGGRRERERRGDERRGEKEKELEREKEREQAKALMVPSA